MTSVIIVAAGMGKRMGSKTAKQYLLIKDRPILYFTLDTFSRCDAVDEIIIVTGKDHIEYVKKEIVEKYGIQKVSHIVSGGSERQYSVKNGLDCVDKNCSIVLVHDGVRPFVNHKHITDIVEQVKVHKACVLGVKSKDTIKICDKDGFVVSTPDRSLLWQAQTPQAFLYSVIKEAYDKAEKEGFLGTDDAMLAENAGYKIKMVEGSYTNIKITTPEDLDTGERILEKLILD